MKSEVRVFLDRPETERVDRLVKGGYGSSRSDVIRRCLISHFGTEEKLREHEERIRKLEESFAKLPATPDQARKAMRKTRGRRNG